VLDKLDNGVIDNGSDLFSNANVSTAVRGLPSLKAVDGNEDGILDSSDAVFSQLQVWQDTNGDGVAQKTELHSLASLGITSLNYA
ncbi:hypothetical protein, partial [Undibacterium sp. CCC3.4]